MNEYRGVVIEESLQDKTVLRRLKILATDIEPVTTEHQTPWLKQWTLHTFEIPVDTVADVAEKLSQALETEHAWYADFKNDATHYIIFKNKVFCVERTRADQYEQVKQYGMSLGIPDYQLDFSPTIQ